MIELAEPVAHVIILGAGLAGYTLAREFIKHDSKTPMILITNDDGRSYSKPMLSTGYTKNTEANDLAQLGADSMARMLKASVMDHDRGSGYRHDCETDLSG